jgi:hypothetical protein
MRAPAVRHRQGGLHSPSGDDRHVRRASLAVPASGEDVRLSYDSRGNIVAIEDAIMALTLRVQRFAPMFGRPGDSVTVVGTGFATTPASNQVTIGGVAATVMAAAADHLK